MLGGYTFFSSHVFLTPALRSPEWEECLSARPLAASFTALMHFLFAVGIQYIRRMKVQLSF